MPFILIYFGKEARKIVFISGTDVKKIGMRKDGVIWPLIYQF
jgi:hypothetical protein